MDARRERVTTCISSEVTCLEDTDNWGSQWRNCRQFPHSQTSHSNGCPENLLGKPACVYFACPMIGATLSVYTGKQTIHFILTFPVSDTLQGSGSIDDLVQPALETLPG